MGYDTSRTKRDEEDDCRPGGEEGGGREARGTKGERRVMSSAFAQPLTGFIRVVCARGLAESPPVTLSRHLRNLIKALRMAREKERYLTSDRRGFFSAFTSPI